MLAAETGAQSKDRLEWIQKRLQCANSCPKVQFKKIGKWFDGGDELFVMPVKTKTQVSIFMQQQSGSHHSVSPEYILSAAMNPDLVTPLVQR